MMNYREYINAVSRLFKVAAIILIMAAVVSCGGNKGKDQSGDIVGTWQITGVDITGLDPVVSAVLFNKKKMSREIAGNNWRIEIKSDGAVDIKTDTEISGKWRRENEKLEIISDEMTLKLNIEEISDNSMTLDLFSIDGIEEAVKLNFAMAAGSSNVKLLVSFTRAD